MAKGMKSLTASLLCFFLLVVCFQTGAPSDLASVPAVMIVEGVASSPQAAPIAALRELDERLQGLSFSVVEGKYVNFGDPAPAEQLDTKDKRLVKVEKLKTGLFRAIVEVRLIPGREQPDRDLKENLIQGTSSLTLAGNLLFARQEARRNACENAILLAVNRRYPATSTPVRLAGKVFFLGTVREEISNGKYEILSRIKVDLAEP